MPNITFLESALTVRGAGLEFGRVYVRSPQEYVFCLVSTEDTFTVNFQTGTLTLPGISRLKQSHPTSIPDFWGFVSSSIMGWCLNVSISVEEINMFWQDISLAMDVFIAPYGGDIKAMSSVSLNAHAQEIEATASFPEDNIFKGYRYLVRGVEGHGYRTIDGRLMPWLFSRY